jgi:hypothetical protein
MFLMRRMARRLARDRGAALVTVVAVVAITAIAGAAITASVLSANGFTATTRAEVQSRSSADAGIDAAFASIYQATYVCSATSPSGGPAYSVVVTYKDASSLSLPCSGSTVLGTPTSAVITSTGYSSNKATQGVRGNQHVARATVSITPAHTNSGTLNNAVFSESGFTLTNNNQLIESTDDANDANVYSNGTVICKTQVDVEGTLTSQGNVSLENTCKTWDDVWAGGSVTFSSQAEVTGNVYAAGTGTMDLSTGHVDGSIITNGSVTMSNSGGVLPCPSSAVSKAVCGSVVALGGTIYAGNGASIGGSAYAKTGVTLNNFNGVTGVGKNVVVANGNFSNDSNSQAGKVAGSVRAWGTIGGSPSSVLDLANSCQKTAGNGFVSCGSAPTIPAPNPTITLPSGLGYPTTGTVKAPAREQMPQINSATSDLASWQSDGWTITNFNAATAAAANTTSCQQAKDFVGTPRAGKQLIVVRDCATEITWDNTTLTLGGDVAMMSTSGFKTNNVFTVQSNTTETRGFLWIVPADSTGITWSAVSGVSPTQYQPACSMVGDKGDIRVNNTTLSNVAWLAYTPCDLVFNNQLNNFKGQLYGGAVNYPNNSTIQLVKFGIPGLTVAGSPSGSTPATATLTGRADVTGG